MTAIEFEALAIKEMRACKAYARVNDLKNACVHFGKAQTYEELLMEIHGVILLSKGGYYSEMYDYFISYIENINERTVKNEEFLEQPTAG